VQILVLIGLYFLKCTKFGQLILRKLLKLLPTCHQLPDFNAKMHQNQFRLELTDPLAGFKGPTSKGKGGEGRGREGRGRGMGEGREGRGEEEEGKGKGRKRKGKGRESDPPSSFMLIPTL